MNQTNTIWTKTFIIVLLSNLILFLAFEMLMPTLPLFVLNIGGNESQVGLVTSIFMLSAISVRLFPGFLASLMDKKYLLLIGIALCGIATILYEFSNSIHLLLLIRVLHGLGFGIATTLFATFVAHCVPPHKIGEGMGYFGVGETLAISLGPLLGVWLIEQYSFNALFSIGGIILFLSFLLTSFVQKAPPTKEAHQTVNTGIKLFERRVLFPCFLIFLTGLSAGSIMSFAAIYAKELDLSNSAWFFFTIAIASFLVRLISGRVYDQKGPAPILIFGSLLSIIGFIILAFCTTEFQFILAAMFYGTGFGAIFPALQAWCSQLVGLHEQESAMASFFNFFDLGIGGGSLILGIIATLHSYQAIYMFAAISYAIFLLIYLRFGLRKTISYNEF